MWFFMEPVGKASVLGILSALLSVGLLAFGIVPVTKSILVLCLVLVAVVWLFAFLGFQSNEQWSGDPDDSPTDKVTWKAQQKVWDKEEDYILGRFPELRQRSRLATTRRRKAKLLPREATFQLDGQTITIN